ncbi:TRAP transporter, DctM subunit [Litoreibacter ascidiaceicola]|mgnify:CR=1 FL=1|uniref:TRAP transporter large permease protein n=1 Tax=Litoreibacter ascidiaceicola TaxID=1486859 RepID=A0A1M5DE96_9RHOB|nr:TRAP transporter large permease subunit [Litoreibacter ascidiaceicola]SHF65398.1 TRAP transporter, DctM subunit [Litoreibacter ascidiaceicola]SHF67945.1 TRAP transporter, DctM subunit [Litoreibacter ascidiaceicola]
MFDFLSLDVIGLGGMTIIALVLLFGLMLTGMALSWVTMTVAAVLLLVWIGPKGISLISLKVYGLSTAYVFVSIPIFIFMASLMERTSIAKDLFAAMQVISGNFRGGTAVQTVLVSVVLAAMSGIMGGEVVLLGLLALPQMIKLGYNRGLSIGTICAGGSLGTMIPPSIVLILFGLAANISVGDLFKAAITPGLLLAASYITYILIMANLKPHWAPTSSEDAELSKLSFREKAKIASGMIVPLLIITAVLGSIYGGVASITESASIGAFSVMLFAALRRELSFKVVTESLRQTITSIGALIWLGLGANALVGIYTRLGGTAYLGELFTGLPFEPIVIVMIMVGIFLLMGMFLDWVGILLLTIPIFIPIVKDLGFDPVWFGILFSISIQVAFLSPPFGPATFYLKSVAPPDVTLEEIYKSTLPFVCIQITVLGLVLAFPQIALWILD